MAPFETLVIFGATGDLAQRTLMPALFNLDGDGLLPAAPRIIGVARSALDAGKFRALVAATLPNDNHERVGRFLARLDYCAIDADTPAGFGALARLIGDAGANRVAFYLATPPSLFAPVGMGLANAGRTGATARLALGGDVEGTRPRPGGIALGQVDLDVSLVHAFTGVRPGGWRLATSPARGGGPRSGGGAARGCRLRPRANTAPCGRGPPKFLGVTLRAPPPPGGGR